MKEDSTKGSQEYRSYTIASFNQWARFYDPFISLFRLKGVRRETVEMSSVRREDRVLDVCTGTGDAALEFAGQCDDVTGIDLSVEMLAVARKKNRESKIRFLQMDATRLNFADREFNVSTISFGLHDMPPEVRERVLREMARVTRKRIVIVDYNPPLNRLLRAIYIALISLYESKYFPDFARSDFEALLARCGLQVEREKALWLGLLRICVCRLDEEAGHVQERGRFLGLRGNQPRSTRFSCFISSPAPQMRVTPKMPSAADRSTWSTQREARTRATPRIAGTGQM